MTRAIANLAASASLSRRFLDLIFVTLARPLSTACRPRTVPLSEAARVFGCAKHTGPH
jgi:hypothetical protein